MIKLIYEENNYIFDFYIVVVKDVVDCFVNFYWFFIIFLIVYYSKFVYDVLKGLLKLLVFYGFLDLFGSLNKFGVNFFVYVNFEIVVKWD